ncbi:hypothetical protein BDN70DRAFT_873958 [Pholiota conissans]|uniref:Zn(2)-C6 fungal-type domain-containing protein n=1 Tax=Pholiota conissans TaxID=109636 RepID=A0A9P5Z9V6_9AGAR|nr:hypothetical protein BDN70DRAFT_873958 [Pholiota conissans]
MASSSSSKPSDERAGGTPGYLPRGGACVSCRRRKMKCDGKRPICSQCDRAGRAEDCEYTTGQERSTVQILEENISRLEARIQELQNPDVASTSVTLHQPYVQDPPRHIAEALLAGFFPFSTDLGFFLNIPRFQASMMQGYPIGHPSRPAPALIYTIYLWSIRLSHDPTVKAHEAAYLFRATQDAATVLSSTHPQRVLHSIQAEVLLTTYFFANGRFFEGKYHLANAVATAISVGMHKIRSVTPQQPQSDNNTIPPPRNSTEEGERIIGAWLILTLDKLWAAALEYTPNFVYSSHAMATQVDTPWPLEMEDFEQGLLPQHVRTANTIQNFLTGVPSPDLGLSTWAFESKAAILWDRANVFVRKCSGSAVAQLTLPPLIQEFTNLSALIDNVVATLPSTDPQEIVRVEDPAQARRLAIGLTILKMATIVLHGPFAFAGRSESSRQTRTRAARSILRTAIALRSRGTGYLSPIIGTAWIEASQVLFDEITLIRTLRASGTFTNTDDAAILSLVQHATTAMADFGVNIPLTSFQVGKIQEGCRTF